MKKTMKVEVGKKYLIRLGSVPLIEVALKNREELKEIEIRAREQVGRIISTNEITYMIEDIYTREDFKEDRIDLLVRVVILDTQIHLLSEQLKDILFLKNRGQRNES